MIALIFAAGFIIAIQPVTVVLMSSIAISMFLIARSLRRVYFAWGVYFAAICANGLAVDVGALTIRPEYIATPLMIASVMANSGQLRKHSRVVLVGLSGWLVVGALSTFLLALDTPASVKMMVQLLIATSPIYFLANASLDTDRLVRIGTSILSIISTVSIFLWLPARDFRIEGVAFEPNVMGSLCAAWLCVVAYVFMSRREISNSVQAQCIPIAIALLLTVTRAAWVALGVLVVFVLVYNSARKPILLIFAFIVTTFGVYYIVTTGDATSDVDAWQWRVLHVFDLISGTGGYRVELWLLAVNDILERNYESLVGTGLNSFSQHHLVDPTRVSAAYLSSLWIGVVYDSGYLGILFFLVLIIGIVSQFERRLLAAPLLVTLAICASLTNIVWFAFPWVFIAVIMNYGANSTSRNHDTNATQLGSELSPLGHPPAAHSGRLRSSEDRYHDAT